MSELAPIESIALKKSVSFDFQLLDFSQRVLLRKLRLTRWFSAIIKISTVLLVSKDKKYYAYLDKEF